MNNTTVSKIALWMYALILLIFAFGHFANGSQMAGSVPAFLPGALVWVYLSGTGLVLAAISFIINKQVRLAGYLLGALLLIIALTIHLTGMMNAKDEMMKWTEMGMLLKDIAIAAAAFYIGSKN